MDYQRIQCPYCAESFEIGIDPSQQGSMIQDCDICCRPITLRIRGEFGEEQWVEVERA